MLETISSFLELPIATVFSVVGLLLLLLALGIRPPDRFINISINRTISSFLGSLLIILGITAHIIPSLSFTSCELPEDLTIAIIKDQGKEKYQNKEYNAAISDFEEVLKHLPNDAIALEYLAKAYRENKQYEASLEAARQLMRAQPDSWLAYQLQAKIYEQKSERKKAIEYYKKAISKNSYDSTLEESLAINYYALKKHKLALDAINKRIIDKPNTTYAYYLRALIYEEMDEIEKSANDFEACVGLGHSEEIGKTCQQVLNTKRHYYVDNQDGTILDKKTGLMWKKCSEGQRYNQSTQGCEEFIKKYSWVGAKTVFTDQSVSFAGYDDWRLPNMKELESLIWCSNGVLPQDALWGCDGRNDDKGTYRQPTINLATFPKTYMGFYISSTITYNKKKEAYYTFRNFLRGGYHGFTTNTKTGSVRLVRSYQPSK